MISTPLDIKGGQIQAWIRRRFIFKQVVGDLKNNFELKNNFFEFFHKAK